METLRKLLEVECDYRMKDETMDAFLGLMTEIHLKNKEPLIPYGKKDNSLYVIKEGIIRRTYFDGMTEKTFTFAGKGTVLISFHSFYRNIPFPHQYESCGESVVCKIGKTKIDELLEESKDFTNWLSTIFLARLYHWEMKSVVIAGTQLRSPLQNQQNFLLT